MIRFMVQPLVLLLCALLAGCSAPKNPPHPSQFFSNINLMDVLSRSAVAKIPELENVEGRVAIFPEHTMGGGYNYFHTRKEVRYQFNVAGSEKADVKADALARYVGNEIDRLISGSDVLSNTIGNNEPHNNFGSHETEKEYFKVKDGWLTRGTIRILAIEGARTEQGESVFLIVLIDEITGPGR